VEPLELLEQLETKYEGRLEREILMVKTTL
jgi:hypothetical protein